MRLALALVGCLVAAPASAWPVPQILVDWQAAMCAYHDKLVADTASGACANQGDCQRLDEQPERMCKPDGGRADQIMDACLAGKAHAARTYVNATASSCLHHLGLLAAYLRDGGISLELYLDNLGDPFAPDARLYPSLTAAKTALRTHARATFRILVLERALWGCGQVFYWQGLTNLCLDAE